MDHTVKRSPRWTPRLWTWNTRSYFSGLLQEDQSDTPVSIWINMYTLIYVLFVEHVALSDVPGLCLCREDVNAFVTVSLLLMDEDAEIRR